MPVHAIVATDQPTTVAVYQLKTILTDAEIKALPTTPIELVPAPGEGKTLIFNCAFIKSKFDGGIYVYDAPEWQFSYGISGLAASWIIAASTFLGTTAPVSTITSPGFRVDNDFNYTASFNTFDPSEIDDTALYLICADSGNFTGGHASNTLEVTVFYSIVDLT